MPLRLLTSKERDVVRPGDRWIDERDGKIKQTGTASIGEDVSDDPRRRKYIRYIEGCFEYHDVIHPPRETGYVVMARTSGRKAEQTIAWYDGEEFKSIPLHGSISIIPNKEPAGIAMSPKVDASFTRWAPFHPVPDQTEEEKHINRAIEAYMARTGKTSLTPEEEEGIIAVSRLG